MCSRVDQINGDSFCIVAVESRSTASCAILFALADSLTTLIENRLFVRGDGLIARILRRIRIHLLLWTICFRPNENHVSGALTRR